MENFGFIKVASAVPMIKVANPQYNASEISALILQADDSGNSIVVFPELALTGSTCGDLFNQRHLQQKALEALQIIRQDTKNTEILIFIGIPLNIKGKLFNCAVALKNGVILGITPKTYLSNYGGCCEKRWFSSAREMGKDSIMIQLDGETVPFGRIIYCQNEKGCAVGAEIGEDLWSPVPPSSALALAGANIIVNLSAKNELVTQSAYRRQLVAQQSGRLICGYIYSSAGVYESTTVKVFSGDALIAENGQIISTSERFKRQSCLTEAEIDLDILSGDRLKNKGFTDSQTIQGCPDFITVELKDAPSKTVADVNSTDTTKPLDAAVPKEPINLQRKIPRNPFVPENKAVFQERCEDIFHIQAAGLAKRLEHTRTKYAVIGVSGGLDSTLALLVTRNTFDILGLLPENILAVTMPGFGTSEGTYQNSLDLMKALGVTIRDIPISEACLLHFRDIGHDPSLFDHTYENVQARERTQILMDLANKIGGLVVGTGDLSELALGWCTYNGDHMSMYGVNAGIPKTLVRLLVRWIAENKSSEAVREVLARIVDTPISPELLPPDRDGKIRQKTEDLIGPYELHDFFLFYTLRYGMKPQKILFLAEKAYSGLYDKKELKHWIGVFYKRFFASQFKRSCLPDGPKIGSISLSPRGDWHMPSDADASSWLLELQAEKE